MYKDVFFKSPVLKNSSTLTRPEIKFKQRKGIDIVGHYFKGLAFKYATANIKFYKKIIPLIDNYSKVLSSLSEDEIKKKVQELRLKYHSEGSSHGYIAESFALAREASGRVLGMRHFNTQLLGGLAIYHGNISEMQTGEGKSLTAILPAVTAAIAGVPVHIITVNEYLAKRDAETMQPVYRLLGISVSVIEHEMNIEERKHAYKQDVVYCTNKDIVFDYLKDLLILKKNNNALHLHAENIKGNLKDYEKLMLRGLHFAIVDEADSVFIDEARTPLIISGEMQVNEQQNLVWQQAISMARALSENKDYDINKVLKKVKLSNEGEIIIKNECADLGFYWSGRVRRIELIEQSLTALHFFNRDHHYLVKDNKIHIIDEHTGRIMEGRTWEKGLHQLIEIKEGCDISSPRSTLAKISYQSFFRKFLHIGGMTGTAKEVSSELWSVYGLNVVSIPPNRTSRRIHHPTHVFFNKSDKWKQIINRISEMYDEGRPVLVGTATLATSVFLSEMLQEISLEHRLLNASQNDEEADIISQAGHLHKITIATSIAGRGTDIKLGQGVEEMGGLHVILTELHDAARIDRQLIGRCARFGDHGSAEYILSFEDSIMGSLPQTLLKFAYENMFSKKSQHKLAIILPRLAQILVERRYQKIRKNLLKNDMKRENILAFSRT